MRPLKLSRLLLSIATVLLILLSVMTWPEQLNPISVLLAVTITTLVVTIASTDFCKIFICTFSFATAIAFTIYSLSAPLGVFQTIDQNPLHGMTDSQFFLYEARRYLNNGDSSVFFSTWGGLIPVLYGVFALQAFGEHYIGIVFFNSLLYAISVFLAMRTFNLPLKGYNLLPLLGLMPLQGLYNAMIAKEPIYLFITTLMLFAVSRFGIQRKLISWNMALFFVTLFIAVVFRPGGAIIVSAIAIFVIYRQYGIRTFFYFLCILTLSLLLLGIYLVSSNYTIPLFFISHTSVGEGFAAQAQIQSLFMQAKNIPESIQPIFSPPWSIILSPFLSLLWLVSPLPFVGGLISSIVAIFDGSFRFGDLANIAKYLDATLIAIMLAVLLIKRIKLWVEPNTLVIFFIFQVMTIVMFNFFEASRHRYLPGFILVLFIMVTVNKHSKEHSIHPKPQGV